MRLTDDRRRGAADELPGISSRSGCRSTAPAAGSPGASGRAARPAPSIIASLLAMDADDPQGPCRCRCRTASPSSTPRPVPFTPPATAGSRWQQASSRECWSARVLWTASPRASLAREVVDHVMHEPHSWTATHADPVVVERVLRAGGIRLRPGVARGDLRQQLSVPWPHRAASRRPHGTGSGDGAGPAG